MRPTIKGQKGEWQPNFWESLPFPKIDGIILPFIVQSLSHVWLFATPWTAALQASLSFTITHSLLKFMSIEFSDAIQPSRPLITFSFCLQSFPSIRVFPNESALCIRWPKDWSFSFNISPSNEYSGLISFRIDWFDLAVQGTLKSLLQYHNLKASVLQHSGFFMGQLSHLYDYWKNIALAITDLPIDCILQGSSIHGILQARILEWVAISFSSICDR